MYFLRLRVRISVLTVGLVLACVQSRAETPVPELVPKLVKEALAAQALPADPRFPIGYRDALESRNRAVVALQKLPPHDQARAITTLGNALKNRSLRQRAQAATVLAALGSVSLPAADALLEALKTPDLEVQTQVSRALGALGQPASIAAGFERHLAQFLKQELSSADPRRRVKGLVTISLLGEGGAQFMAPAVIKMLNDPEPHVRSAAAQTLGSLRSAYSFAAPALFLLLDDSENWVRSSAWLALGKMGSLAKPALPKLLLALQSKDADLRDAAKSALGELRDHAAEIVPALARQLSDADSVRRTQAAEALSRLGEAARAAVPDLVGAATDRDPDTQRAAQWALAAMGQAAQPGVGRLKGCLRSSDAFVRKSAAITLGRLPQLAAEVFPALLEAARDPDSEVQGAAAQSLADLGSLARGAVPQLKEMLGDTHADVRKLAALALGRMGSEAFGAVQKLQEMARSEPDPDAKLAAVQALGSLHDPARPGGAPDASVNLLISLCASEDPRLKQAALTALQSTPAPRALAAAQDALSASSPGVREAAVGLIAALGLQGAPAFGALVQLLRDKDASVSRRVASAMTQLGPILGASQVSVISALARDRNASQASRLNAVKALCRLEKYAASASGVLVSIVLARSEPENLRAHAAFALKVVGGYPRSLEPRLEALLKKKREYFQAIDF